MNEKIKLVCFDLNKTLIVENSWKDLNLAMGITDEEDEYYLQEYNQGRLTYREAQATLLHLYKERGNPTRSAISQAIYRYTYHEGAQEIVRFLQENEYHLALISGSMDILVSRIAKELHIPFWGANNEFVFDENNSLQDIIVLNDEHTAKLIQLKEICEKLKIPLHTVACVGDGDNDRTIFEETKRGITFPGSKLESIAWKIVTKLTDIEKVL